MLKRFGSFILTLILTFSLLSLLPAVVLADEATDLNHDVMFVIDASTSMLKADSNNLSAEAAKLFMDMCVQSSSRVGYVIYNDKIVASSELRSISTAEAVAEIKNVLDHPMRQGYTDIGMALKEGVQLMLSSPSAEGDRHPLIILLSDGDTVLPPGSARTMEDSENDLNSAISAAKNAGVPVYTIALNYKFGADVSDVDPQKMAEIASRTDGLSYLISEANQLPETLTEIFTNSMKTTQSCIGSFTGDGNSHDITVSIPNASIYEANIIILSSKPVSNIQLREPKGTEVLLGSERATYITSAVYTIIKLHRPVSGDWILSLVGATGDDVTINLISYYGLDVALRVEGKDFLPGDTVRVSLYYDRDGEIVADSSLLQGTDATLYIRDPDGRESNVPMSASGNELVGEFTVKKIGQYTLYARAVAKDKAYDKQTDSTSITVSIPPLTANLPAESTISMYVQALEHSKEVSLENLFHYAEDTELTVTAPLQMEEGWNQYCDIVRDGSILRFDALKAGKADATVVVTDKYGQTASHLFHIEIKPIWPFIVAAAALILLLLLVLFLIKRSKMKPLSGSLYVRAATADEAGRTTYQSMEENLPLSYLHSKRGKNRLTELLNRLKNQELRQACANIASGDEQVKGALLEKRKVGDDVLYLYLPKQGKGSGGVTMLGHKSYYLRGSLADGGKYSLALRYQEGGNTGPVIIDEPEDDNTDPFSPDPVDMSSDWQNDDDNIFGSFGGSE